MICEANKINKCAVKVLNHPLDKIHVKQDSNCEFLFTKCKIGKSIWKRSSKPQDFAFFDPYNRAIKADYNPLHDPFLKPYLMRKAQLNHLRKSNLITDTNEIICDVKEFNDFRKILHRLKIEDGASERKTALIDSKDWNRVKLSDQTFKHINEKRQKFLEKYGGSDGGSDRCNPARHVNVVEVMKRRKFVQESLQMEKFKENLKNYQQRVNKFQQIQHLHKNQIKERADYRNLESVKKQIFVMEKERRHQIETKKKLMKREKAVNKNLAKKLDDRPKKMCLIVKCPLKI